MEFHYLKELKEQGEQVNEKCMKAKLCILVKNAQSKVRFVLYKRFNTCQDGLIVWLCVSL